MGWEVSPRSRFGLNWRALEQVVKGKRMDASSVGSSGAGSAVAEIKPIDDIRSTAKYRAMVAGNLVEEFLVRLGETA